MGRKNRNMATRPLIGVTGSAKRFSPSWWCTRIAVWLAGGCAQRISVRHHPQETLLNLDALLVGGGDDIDPALYGGEALATEEFDRARDALESRYLKHAWQHGLPIMGICRGAQLLNVIRGGNLLNDVRHLRKITTNKRRITRCKHVHFEQDSIIAAITGTQKLGINSLHHQAIHHAGTDLKICGKDEDGIVQSIHSTHDQHIAIGVQWHPEYLFLNKAHLNLFRWLVNQAKMKRSAESSHPSD